MRLLEVGAELMRGLSHASAFCLILQIRAPDYIGRTQVIGFCRLVGPARASKAEEPIIPAHRLSSAIQAPRVNILR
jgi:hypothetical protein